NVNNEREACRKETIMGSLAFLITGPIMGAQFIYASVIHKTFPGFTMPSFAIQEIPADSLLRST
ncbi:MAG: hypothetical protein HRU40_19765, partial [Saprospiraceae bacterium]|nr:hypothetical protein [Saprospiraceae bacterium]